MAIDKIVKTSASRVFLIEGRARADHVPAYQSSLRMTGLSQGFGDIEKIEVPDPDNYGQFIEAAQIKGATERATTTLEGRYAMELKSTLMKFALQGCAFDVQLHIGECTNPSLFNTFKKAIVLESASVTTIGTDDLGALASGDNAGVNETADISATRFYEILPLAFTGQAASTVTKEMLAVTICDSITCGECESQSDGVSKIYAVSVKEGGSGGTPPDIVFSIDKGGTWYAHDIDALSSAQDANGIDCVGLYVVVTSTLGAGIAYTLKSTLDGPTDPTFTLVTTGVVAGKAPIAIWSAGSYAFVVGNGGYVYGTSDPTSGLDVLDAGSATIDDLWAVHGISDEMAVAVGESGAVVYTLNGVNWTAATRPVGVGVTLETVWVKSKTEWWVGTGTGRMYYTLNSGVTWTEKGFSGSGTGRVTSIVFATESVAYMAHSTTAPRGRIFRSYDGGYSWNIMPESGTLPLVDRINQLAVGALDANFVVGVGLNDDGADGVILLGDAA